ncbi:MAG: carboxypeptidase regulatory-like domain-containing protein [Nibricoccus sp.]
MNTLRLFLFCLSCAVGSLVTRGAEVEGRVQLPKATSAPMVTERYAIVTSNGVMATNPPLAVIYLEGKFARPAEPATVKLVQKDLTFVPALLPIQTGTKVEFPNLDDVYHSVFSYSKPKRFDLGRYQPGEKPVPFQVFDRPGLVTVRCDIHEHMRGLILVLDTPHFVLTDPKGEFRLTGLPTGHYVLKAWIDSETTKTQEVDLVEGTTVRAEFQ